mmetsp:Transcript_16967/g.41855  ORF Transcript_16967/g.41855 Transcript_16967/m.41855 type:complete len:259 (+) Transcript_16967:391-1167(+)
MRSPTTYPPLPLSCTADPTGPFVSSSSVCVSLSSSSSSPSSRPSSLFSVPPRIGFDPAMGTACMACVHLSLNAMLKKRALPGSNVRCHRAAVFAARQASLVDFAFAAAAATTGSDARNSAPLSRSRATAAALASLMGAAAAFAAAISRHSVSLDSAATNALLADLTSSAWTTPPLPSRAGAEYLGSKVITRAAPKLTLTIYESSARSRALSPCAPMLSLPSQYRLHTAWLHTCPDAAAIFAEMPRMMAGGALGVGCCV